MLVANLQTKNVVVLKTDVEVKAVMIKRSREVSDIDWLDAVFAKAKRTRNWADLLLLLRQHKYREMPYGLNLLGYCYNLGLGVPQDYKKARRYYMKAAKHGCLDSYYNLALLYEHCLGVKANSKKTFRYYLVAAQGGIADAQCNLATCYLDGVGVEKNVKKGLFWLEKAAKSDDIKAQYNLGIALLTLKSNVALKHAKKWLKMAANRGHKKALATIARLGKHRDERINTRMRAVKGR